MTAQARHSAIRLGTLALGTAMFAGVLYYINLRTTLDTARRLGLALPLALLLGGLYHLVRTCAWAACFPQPRRIGFLRLARVRMSAEAFSYLTVSGVAGEPVKVVLLSGAVDAREATAAVALERIAFLVGTGIIVGAGAACALIGLPLTPVWRGVFRAFAIGSATLTLFAIAAVLGRGTYVRSLLGHVDHALGRSLGASKAGRFAAAVEAQMLELVRGNPRRLLLLMGTTAVAYLLMVAEAWVILRAAGAPITPNRAFAVETLSRVASFASAFIPANLGALEVSSLAAVSAVGASAGGAALALGRRVRGLFWAGVGLAIYPSRAEAPRADAEAEPSDAAPGATLLYCPAEPGLAVSASARLAGLPIAERVIRAAARAGYARIVVRAAGSARPGPSPRMLRRLAREVDSRIVVARVTRQWAVALASIAPTDAVTIVGAGTVVSAALLARARELPAHPGSTLDVPAGPDWPESGVVRMTAAAAADYEHVARELAARRPRGLPQPSGADVSNGQAMLAIRIADPAQLAVAEETIRRASYKDTDSKIAQFNRRISLPISVKLIATPLTANQLSICLVALGFYSGWLFSLGHYWTGVLAAFLSLAASVLDGCDGEIARLKYQESALGCWIETFGDYSYYLAIFTGLTIGAVRQTHWHLFGWLGGVALAGTLLSFGLLIFLRSRITAGRPEKLHAVAGARFQSELTVWSRLIWRLAFVATRAAMPYGIMAFSLLNVLPVIVVLAAIGANVYWMSLVAKMPHLLGRSEAVAAA